MVGDQLLICSDSAFILLRTGKENTDDAKTKCIATINDLIFFTRVSILLYE